MLRLYILVILAATIFAQVDLSAKDQPDKQNGIRIEKDGVYLGTEPITWDRLKEVRFNGSRLIASKSEFESLSNHISIYFHNDIAVTLPRGIRVGITQVDEQGCTIEVSTRDRKAQNLVIAGIALEPDKPLQINFKINQDTGSIDVSARNKRDDVLISKTSLTNTDINIDFKRDEVRFEGEVDKSPVKDPPVASQFKPNPPGKP